MAFTSSALVAVNVCIIPPKPIVDLSLRACRQLCESLQGTDHYYVLHGGVDVEEEKKKKQKKAAAGGGASASSETVTATQYAKASPQHGIPHCTLYQLFAKPSELDQISAKVKEIVKATVEAMMKSNNAHRNNSQLLLTCEPTLAPGPVFGKFVKQAGEGSDSSSSASAIDIHVPSIVIANQGIVKRLHENIVAGLRAFHNGCGGDSVAKTTDGVSFFQSTFNSEWPASESSANWTLNFEKKAAFEKYFPHITLGSTLGKPDSEALKLPSSTNNGKGEEEGVDFSFMDSIVIVSEMANNCCCYKILDVVAP